MSLVLFCFFVRKNEGCEQKRDEFNYHNHTLTHEEPGLTTGGGSHDLVACSYTLALRLGLLSRHMIFYS